MTTASHETDIALLLALACEHDVQARALRTEAGRLLARLRIQHPGDWLQRTGLDARTADKLLMMGSGRD